MNPQYEAHERFCKYIGAMAKENEDLKQHVTQLENRLRALWDKYYGDLNHHMGRIKRLEREVELFRKYSDYGDVDVVDSILRGEEMARKESNP